MTALLASVFKVVLSTAEWRLNSNGCCLCLKYNGSQPCFYKWTVVVLHTNMSLDLEHDLWPAVTRPCFIYNGVSGHLYLYPKSVPNWMLPQNTVVVDDVIYSSFRRKFESPPINSICLYPHPVRCAICPHSEWVIFHLFALIRPKLFVVTSHVNLCCAALNRESYIPHHYIIFNPEKQS